MSIIHESLTQLLYHAFLNLSTNDYTKDGDLGGGGGSNLT